MSISPISFKHGSAYVSEDSKKMEEKNRLQYFFEKFLRAKFISAKINDICKSFIDFKKNTYTYRGNLAWNQLTNFHGYRLLIQSRSRACTLCFLTFWLTYTDG